MAEPVYTLRRIGATATQAEALALSNTLRPFFKGDPGASTSAAQISSDAGNMLTPGSDFQLFVPESFAVAARFSEISGNQSAVIEARSSLGIEDIDCGTFN